MHLDDFLPVLDNSLTSLHIYFVKHSLNKTRFSPVADPTTFFEWNFSFLAQACKEPLPRVLPASAGTPLLRTLFGSFLQPLRLVLCRASLEQNQLAKKAQV
jgi:hypothetical protein